MPWNRAGSRILLLSLFTLLLSTTALAQTVVRMDTSLGPIDIRLFDAEAPLTVANFLNYVNDGDYNQSFIHRHDGINVNRFVQGGGFTFIDDFTDEIEMDPPVTNEFGMSNVRGTLSMAKVAGDPNSGTNQWFINVTDNSDPFDTDNGGFTVFGEVIGDGMDVVDAINALQTVVFNAPFNQIPLRGFFGLVNENHLVMINTIQILGTTTFINEGMNGAWFNLATPGQGFFIDVLPETGIVFISAFTYDIDQPDASIVAVVGDPGQRWLTAQGAFSGNSATLDITNSSGGLFDNNAAVTNSPAGTYGTITITFSSCGNATITYTLTESGLTGTIPLVRVASDNVAVCEANSRDLEFAALTADPQ